MVLPPWSRPITELRIAGRLNTVTWSSRRLDLIAADPSIRLLERPEFKRRWAPEPWENGRSGHSEIGSWVGWRIRGCGWTSRAAGAVQRRQFADVGYAGRTLGLGAGVVTGAADIEVTRFLGSSWLIRRSVPRRIPVPGVGVAEARGVGGDWALQRREDAGEKVDPSRCRRNTRPPISGRTPSGRRGGSWTCRRSGSSSIRPPGGRAIRRLYWAGPGGTTEAVPGAVADRSGGRTAGPRTGWYRSLRA